MPPQRLDAFFDRRVEEGLCELEEAGGSAALLALLPF
jgi:hypothetical protein